MTKLEQEAELEFDTEYFENTGEWRFKSITCRKCGWTTTDKDDMIRHIAERNVILRTLTSLQKKLGGSDSAKCARNFGIEDFEK